MMKPGLLRLTLYSLFSTLYLLSTFGCAKAEELKGSIQIKGSDTMVNLGQAWAEAFTKRHPLASVAVTGGGSGTGIAAMISGTCDITMSSRSMKDKELNLAKAKAIKPIQHTVGLDGIAVVVHPLNPVKNLTTAQLRDIFMGNVRNWKDIGGKSGRIVVLSREINSGTHVFFKEHVLRRGNEKGPEEFAPDALLMPSSQAIADETAQNPSAIGYYGMGYITAKQKVIAVAKEKTSQYIDPGEEAVRQNEYPISRPLFLYTRGKPQGAVEAFMDFVLSEEGQKIVREIDFVPVK